MPSEFVSMWRALGFDDELFATTLLDRRILFYPAARFDDLMRRIMAQQPASAHAMRTMHVLNRNGARTTIDKDERIALPSRLRRTAAEVLHFAPPAEALLVGSIDHVELLFDVEPVQLAPEDFDRVHDFSISPLPTLPTLQNKGK